MRSADPDRLATSLCAGDSAGGVIPSVGQAHQRRQRRAQVVRDRRQQRVAQALGLDLHGAALRHVDVMDALQRDRQQRGAGSSSRRWSGPSSDGRRAPRPARRAGASAPSAAAPGRAHGSVSVPKPACCRGRTPIAPPRRRPRPARRQRRQPRRARRRRPGRPGAELGGEERCADLGHLLGSSAADRSRDIS